MRRFLISDTHFGHSAIMKIDLVERKKLWVFSLNNEMSLNYWKT